MSKKSIARAREHVRILATPYDETGLAEIQDSIKRGLWGDTPGSLQVISRLLATIKQRDEALLTAATQFADVVEELDSEFNRLTFENKPKEAWIRDTVRSWKSPKFGTVSGRIQSKKPNIANTPKVKHEIRD